MRCFLTTNLAEVERNSKVMVHKGGVLLRVQNLMTMRVDLRKMNLKIYFKKGCTRVSMDPRCHFVNLNEHRHKKVVLSKKSPRPVGRPGYSLL